MNEENTANWYESIPGGKCPKFEKFINTESKTVVVKEPQLQSRATDSRAQLRSLPLFHLFNFNTVVHTDEWDNQFKLIDYNHVSAEDADPSELSFPLVHFVTQEGIEEHGEEDLVRKLVERSINEENRYILVTDTVSPKTPSVTMKAGKSIVDEFGEITVKDYNHLSSVFLENYLDSKIPVVDSRNIFFHAASTIHYPQDAPSDSIEDIFDYNLAPSNSPVWEPVRIFLRLNLANIHDDYSEHIQEGLRSWIEDADTQRIADQILEVLQTCEYNYEQLEEYRQRPPEHR